MTAYNVRTWGFISLIFFVASLVIPLAYWAAVIMVWLAWLLVTVIMLAGAQDVADLINEIRSVKWED